MDAAMAQRGTTTRGSAARERILDAASELIFRHGLNATGLAEVGTTSQTGKSQLYHYFHDKQDLAAAVIARQWNSIRESQAGLIEGMNTAEDLRLWGAAAIEAHREADIARCPLGSLAGESAGRDPRVSAALAKAFRAWHETLSGAVRRMQVAGEARTDRSAEELADVLLSAYEGGVILSSTRHDVAPLLTAVEAAIEFVTSRR